MKDLKNILNENMEKFPDKTVIYWKDHQLNYRQLKYGINKVGQQIREAELSSNDIVLLIMKPSPELIASILALIEMEITYVPIGFDTPIERINQIQDTVHASLVLTNIPNLLIFQKVKINFVDFSMLQFLNQNSPLLSSSTNKFNEVAYIIFTSGSTGRPKGVQITYQNLDHLVSGLQRKFEASNKSIFALTTPISFDVSTTEIFGWILPNASLLITDLEINKDFRNTIDLAVKRGVTHFSTSPAAFRSWDNSDLQKLNDVLDYLVVAGEEFPVSLVPRIKKYLPDVNVVNGYGPTETTVYATLYNLKKMEETSLSKSIPIGTSFPGNKVIIVDEHDNIITEENKQGELLVGGNGVTKGYIDELEKNKKLFVIIGQHRYYRTGDIVYWNSSNLIFVGRKDSQIEVNGIRVELGDIEAAIDKLPYVKKSIVFYYNKTILAAIEKEKGVLLKTNEAIRNDLLPKLPRYELPSKFLMLDKFPLTQNRKIDRNVILRKLISDKETFISEAKITDNEQKIKTILIANFPIFSTGIEVTQSLFDFSFDSLDSVLFQAMLEQRFQKKFPDNFLYQCNTIQKISREIFGSKTELQREYNFLDYTEVNGKNFIYKFTKAGPVLSIVNPNEPFASVSADDQHLIENMISNNISRNNLPTRINATKFEYHTLNRSSIKQDFLFNSDRIQRQAGTSFPEMSYQRAYQNVNFSSFVTIPIRSVLLESEKNVLPLLKKVVQATDVLRATIGSSTDNPPYQMTIHGMPMELKVPVFKAYNINNDEILEFENKLIEYSFDVITDANFSKLLYTVFVVRKSLFNFDFIFILHHTIADAASNEILKRKFYDIYNDIPIDNNTDVLSFKNYATDVMSKSNEDLLSEDSFVQNVIKRIYMTNFSKINYSKNHYAYEINQSMTNEQKILRTLSYITKDFLQQTPYQPIVVQTLINFRKLGTRNFSSLVGDCHAALTIYRDPGENVLTFENRVSWEIETQLKKCLSLNQSLYRTHPNLNLKQQILKDILEVPISINFLGEVSQDRLDDMVKSSIQRGQQSLSSLESHKIRYIGVTHDSTLHILRIM
ncbi:non-ribosomal peptide synthetase [Rummeliibacillus suwonensis]|uniref:non-ribosomal peptide synthetase n=1 Tax=Rummeliibacillus suwonensis TaxID=1306154 RepID=UPI001AAEC47E|nr:non-ribosomal peptide synthetase [Rummeliibacillus suwonensis]MBO2535626.1 AMP-binding protein [Rummeliibacillus suwonensis]